jgi:hypothetical protein
MKLLEIIIATHQLLEKIEQRSFLLSINLFFPPVAAQITGNLTFARDPGIPVWGTWVNAG